MTQANAIFLLMVFCRRNNVKSTDHTGLTRIIIVIRNVIVILGFTILISACKTTEVKSGNVADIEVKNVDINQGEEKSFFSSQFRINLSVPSSWSVSGKETIDAVADIGGKIISGDDEIKKILHEESKKRTENIFLISQYEVGTPVQFNPSIVSVSENIALAPGIKSGKDYLYHVEQLLLGSAANYSIVEHYKPTIISSYSFDAFKAKTTINGTSFYQDYYATKAGKSVLSFIITYSNQEEFTAFDKVLKNIKIEENF